jgi:hypothetical protein
MQTFLPYPDLKRSAQCLDNKRLGKQRVEALTILRTLNGGKQGWAHHPAVKMWRGYENALRLYMNTCIEEWIRRGFKNTMKMEPIVGEIIYPHWFGSVDFHSSHRSNLLRKDHTFYNKYGWRENASMPYIWPVN